MKSMHDGGTPHSSQPSSVRLLMYVGSAAPLATQRSYSANKKYFFLRRRAGDGDVSLAFGVSVSAWAATGITSLLFLFPKLRGLVALLAAHYLCAHDDGNAVRPVHSSVEHAYAYKPTHGTCTCISRPFPVPSLLIVDSCRILRSTMGNLDHFTYATCLAAAQSPASHATH
ncbi:hypothetical protein EV127DRAFT_49313 [Xylaria flabelliformis]|nr:hypothetical protein EV127DRAFT_49313 [Xylaria flabelliformis]